MTDKNIKDYCKNCDVEPPAMRLKCPECEHNPDKEQIIIDGVDVSECVHYEDLSCTAFRDSCGYPLDCKDFFFCNYKQLARKTQECEQIKEKYEALKLENQEGYEIVAELKHECEELKEKYEEIKEDRYNLNMEMYTFDRYRKTLEEIEEYCKNQISITGDLPFRTTASDILNIINRAKGKE